MSFWIWINEISKLEKNYFGEHLTAIVFEIP